MPHIARSTALMAQLRQVIGGDGEHLLDLSWSQKSIRSNLSWSKFHLHGVSHRLIVSRDSAYD